MKGINITTITTVCKGQLYLPEGYIDNGTEAAGVCIDSRLVQEGYVFIATKGARVDGHTFINQVAAMGALAAVVEDVPEQLDIPCIKVDSSFQALKDIAAFYRQQLDIKVVGITGSVGKTSTKEFVATVLSEHYRVLKTEGNLNNEVGLPLTVLKIKEDTQVAVLEMGISEFGEMSRLSAIANPDICVITNIGTCHLENLGDRDGVFKAKTECFANLKSGGYVVLNGNDDKLIAVKEVGGRAPVRFGDRNVSQVYTTSVKSKGLLGSDVVICDNMDGAETSITAHVPLPGEHMVANAMAATAVAHILGLTSEEIAKGIESVKATQGRSNIIETDKYVLIDDCYNANPVSVKAAIDLLGNADGRKVAILGDMFELGTDECLLHEEVGKYASSHATEVIICIGELSAHMYRGAMSELMCEAQEIVHFDTLDEAMDRIPAILQEGDTVLIKASHGMHFEKIVEALS